MAVASTGARVFTVEGGGLLGPGFIVKVNSGGGALLTPCNPLAIWRHTVA